MDRRKIDGSSIARDNGLIVKATGGFYYVETSDCVVECTAKGIFRKREISPLVGDNVEIELSADKTGTVSKIFERKNKLTRPPLANLDKIFVVTSIVEPPPNTMVLDSFIAVCEYKDIEPVLIVSKNDLSDTKDFEAIYKKAGFDVVSVNMHEDEKVQELKELMSGCITAFSGNTGVGKSSILNLICPNLNLQTAQISQKLGRGKHTTRHVELYKLPEINAYIADTPGFTTMDIMKYDIILKEDLHFCFREFKKYFDTCKYKNCGHTVEDGCSILQAVQSGEISKSRHDCYVQLYNDAKKIKEWEHKRK